MTEQTLRTFLRDRFPAYHESLRVDDDLTRVVDSLGLFELVAFVEAECQVRIPTAMFPPERFTSLRRTLDFVKELQALLPAARR